MGRFSAGVKTSAGSTTLPLISVYGITSRGGWLREVGLFNTTTTAVDVKLIRLTSAGTPGSGITEGKHDPDGPDAQLTAFTTHSSTPPSAGDDLGYRASIGAAIGAGVIWTFGDTGIKIPTGTANGIGVVIENGTGQALQAYLVWDE